ncbi:FMN-binding protein [Patescibacteria group bacterium]|nr:FMN-binding protein [Patescibacteria group bacterium]
MQTNKFIVGFLLVGTFVVYAVYTQQAPVIITSPVVITGEPDTILPITSPVPATIPSTTVVPVAIPTTSTSVTTDPVPVPAVPPTSIPVPKPIPAPTPKPVGQYRDGTYTGDSVDVYYGNVQVAAVVRGGKITSVKFLEHPQDRPRSIAISNYAMPLLITEAIQAQRANVDTVSGATATSGGFVQSLFSALAQAKNE